MPRISEIHFNNNATNGFPANEFVEIALSQEEYAAFQAGDTQVRLALYQSDGRNSFDFTVPLNSFILDEDANEWVAVENGTGFFTRTGSDTPSNRWAISSAANQNDSPPSDTFISIETIGVYTRDTTTGAVVDSQIVSANGDGTERAAPVSGALNGQQVDSIAITPSSNPQGSLQFNAPQKDNPVLANPTPGDTGVVCFTAGTLIRTSEGELPIEDLKKGDSILTMDMGYQKLRWIGSQSLNSEMLKQKPHLRPIRIRAGALGKEHPRCDLIVSPQHRILVNGPIPHRMFGTYEVLVAAKHLLELEGIEIADNLTEVVYFHILFDQHQIIWANGSPAESLYTGKEALKTLHKKQLEEIAEVFPELDINQVISSKNEMLSSPARHFVVGRRSKSLAARIKNNSHEVFFKTNA